MEKHLGGFTFPKFRLLFEEVRGGEERKRLLLESFGLVDQFRFDIHQIDLQQSQ